MDSAGIHGCIRQGTTALPPAIVAVESAQRRGVDATVAWAQHYASPGELGWSKKGCGLMGASQRHVARVGLGELGGEGAPSAAVGAQLALRGCPQQWRQPQHAGCAAARAVPCFTQETATAGWAIRIAGAFKRRTATADAGA